MKPIITFISAALVTFGGYSQSEQQSFETPFATKATSVRLTKPLREITPTSTAHPNEKVGPRQDTTCYEEYLKTDIINPVNDKVLQDEFGSRAPATMVEVSNFDALDEVTANVWVGDPSGAAGPNYYVQMVNYTFAIYDKSGNLAYGPSGLSAIFGSNGYDGVVMYDRYADRWVMTQHLPIQIAVSQTNDPLGSWYVYTFNNYNTSIDYAKFAIWHDGYYFGNWYNTIAAFERDSLLVGSSNAQMVALNLPDVPISAGQLVPLPAWCDGDNLPPAGTPQYFFLRNNDPVGYFTNDHIRVYEMSVDWTNTSNSTIVLADTINVSPFDAQSWWTTGDITQPNTGVMVISFSAIPMHRVQYRRWGNYNTALMSHAVYVNGTDVGCRWHEFRQDENTGDWSLYQEGTYAPDSDDRWMPNISMDKYGNIAMAYNVSGSSIYPSIHYTGRLSTDPLGQMTVQEKILCTGNSAAPNYRWGDYIQMTMDPADDATFWYSGVYHNNGIWWNRAGAFKFDPFISVEEGINTPEDLTAYYNAQSRQIVIRTTGDLTGQFDISVYDILGRQIVSKRDVMISVTSPFTVNTNKLTTGTYVVKVENQDVSETIKLMVY